MKFKFCSDGDCPLWALAALHALGSLPAPTFRTLLQHVLDELPDDGIMAILKDTNLSSRDECARAAAVLRWTLRQTHRGGCSGVQLARVYNITHARSASRDECARAAAVLRWTLRQTHRGGCSGVQLARDLLVLGVPRAHASALADAADTTRRAYETHITNNGFMVNKLTDVKASPGPEGTVDTITLSLHSDEVFTGEQRTSELIIDKSQVKSLLQELKKAKQKMDEIVIE
ncbi:COMM domain-containing protein 4 isoform X1 [Bicyclus anynana]|uniref:COMM domain-containing protein 4 isoform X1 n=1 Tax=Bicyclus anynana TaxID=110368 RepID=A0ABM3LZB0_BICAN|nr:COMM domain-containing protein 4 isoform X1 [Bicyclus anynana]XP_052744416.1 COMM domain-containing protein 4 isoform X1 [Bicyclus anynana]